MPTLFGRQYVRKIEDIGPTEKVLGVLILFLVAGVVVGFVVHTTTNRDYLFNVDEKAYGEPAATGEPQYAERTSPAVDDSPGQATASAGESAGPSAAKADNPFPDPGLSGWRTPKRVRRFTADDLYVKINGRAEAFLKFHVVGLTFGSYDHQTNPERIVDVYWYDMGKPANAYNMYRSEAPPQATPIPIGRQGYQVDGAVFFCKGSSYVQVLPTLPGDADAQAARAIAGCLAERIQDGSETPKP